MSNHVECPKCHARFPGVEIPESHFCQIIGDAKIEKRTQFQLKHQAKAILASMEKFQGRILRTWKHVGHKPVQTKQWQDTASLLSDMQVMHDLLELFLPFATKEVLEHGEKIALGTEQDEDDEG